MRVGLAQFIYESNTFNPVLGELDCFTEQGSWLTTAESIRQWSAGTATQMGGSLRALAECGWEAVPFWVAVCGTPGGRLSGPAYAAVRAAWREGVRGAMPCDALILHLHGAVCAEGVDDVEGALLTILREELGYAGKVVLTLDLHAQVTPRMLAAVDLVTAYRTAPHEDFVETGERAVAMLREAPVASSRTLARVAALIPPTATHHGEGPFAEMLREARSAECEPGVVEISLFPVQPWLNVEGLASSVVVTATDPEVGERVAARLAEAWFAQRNRWPTGLQSWEKIRGKLAQRGAAPWVLVDTADATSGGSAGDSAEALRQLWSYRDGLAGDVLLWVVDPGVVTTGTEGQTHWELGRQKFRVEAAVEFVGKCRFRPRGRAYTGQEISCGGAIGLVAGRLRILVTEKGCLCSDPAFYEAVGWSPETALAVQVKTLLGWQPGYGVGTECGLYFDGPGLTSLNFARLSYSRVSHELWPLTSVVSEPVQLWQSN